MSPPSEVEYEPPSAEAEEASESEDEDAAAPQPADVPIPPMHADLRAVSRFEDYLLRGPAFHAYSPVIMAMLFYKVRPRSRTRSVHTPIANIHTCPRWPSPLAHSRSARCPRAE